MKFFPLYNFSMLFPFKALSSLPVINFINKGSLVAIALNPAEDIDLFEASLLVI